MPELKYEGLTHQIIGAYYEVYNHTSRTYPERIYEQAMIEELRRRDIRTSCQDKYQIMYKGMAVGWHQLDLFVTGQVVVEHKVADQVTRLHKAQAISYLKVVDKSVGLLLNFGNSEPEFNRLYFNPAKKPGASIEDTTRQKAVSSQAWLYPDLAYQIVGGLFEVHTILGAGYVHRIYANACYHELKLRGLETEARKRMQVAYKDTVVGDIAFGHLLVEGKVIVFPVAIGSTDDLYLDNLKQWMRLCDIELAILANFDAINLEIIYIRA